VAGQRGRAHRPLQGRGHAPRLRRARAAGCSYLPPGAPLGGPDVALGPVPAAAVRRASVSAIAGAEEGCGEDKSRQPSTKKAPEVGISFNSDAIDEEVAPEGDAAHTAVAPKVGSSADPAAAEASADTVRFLCTARLAAIKCPGLVVRAVASLLLQRPSSLPPEPEPNPCCLGDCDCATERREASSHREASDVTRCPLPVGTAEGRAPFSPELFRRHARFVFVGDGPLRAGLQALVGAHGLGDMVQFTGHIPQEAVLQLMQQADVLINPSVNGTSSSAQHISLLTTLSHLLFNNCACSVCFVYCGVLGETFGFVHTEAAALSLPLLAFAMHGTPESFHELQFGAHPKGRATGSGGPQRGGEAAAAAAAAVGATQAEEGEGEEEGEREEAAAPEHESTESDRTPSRQQQQWWGGELLPLRDQEQCVLQDLAAAIARIFQQFMAEIPPVDAPADSEPDLEPELEFEYASEPESGAGGGHKDPGQGLRRERGNAVTSVSERPRSGGGGSHCSHTSDSNTESHSRKQSHKVDRTNRKKDTQCSVLEPLFSRWSAQQHSAALLDVLDQLLHTDD
jgi:glycosyltransferase involved in cell wall biosynthesis